MRRGVMAAACFAALSAPAWAEQTAAQLRHEFDYKCEGDKLSHVEQSICLADADKRMSIRLAAEYKKALAAAEGDASSEAIGGRSGAERARKEIADLSGAQQAWEAYRKAECHRVREDIDLEGGNSADVAGYDCDLDHMAQRIVELQP